MTFEQRAAMRQARVAQGKKHVAERAERQAGDRLQKEPMPPRAFGIRSAIHEWVRALLGVPRSSPASTFTEPSVNSILEHHLPDPPTTFEIYNWANYETC